MIAATSSLSSSSLSSSSFRFSITILVSQFVFQTLLPLFLLVRLSYTFTLLFFSILSDITMAFLCRNCGLPGHASNAHPDCLFFGRNPENHPDASRGDNVPHMAQLHIRVFADGSEQPKERKAPYWHLDKTLEICVNNESFRRGEASGAGCNCLIDTLRQKLPGAIDVSIPDVRAELENRHRDTVTHIEAGEYLDLDFSLEIIDLLGTFSGNSRVSQAWSDQFQVILCCTLQPSGNFSGHPIYCSKWQRLYSFSS